MAFDFGKFMGAFGQNLMGMGGGGGGGLAPMQQMQPMQQQPQQEQQKISIYDLLARFDQNPFQRIQPMQAQQGFYDNHLIGKY